MTGVPAGGGARHGVVVPDHPAEPGGAVGGAAARHAAPRRCARALPVAARQRSSQIP